MATRARNDRLCMVLRLGGHSRSAATQQASARHPDRNAEGDHQSHSFHREKRAHFRLGVYSPPRIFANTFVPFCGNFCNERLAKLKTMHIDKDKIKTQDELDEAAPMEQAEQRVEAEMKELEEKAKREVAEGLKKQDEPDQEDED